MKSGIKAIVLVLNILYPFAVLAGLKTLDSPVKVFPFALTFIIVLNLLANVKELRERNFSVLYRIAMMTAAGAVVVVLMLITKNAGLAKLYPVVINAGLLAFFGLSLIYPPTVIWRLATLQDKTLNEGAGKDEAESYCRKLTIIWCVFFVVNALISLSTAIWASDAIWTIYNGFVSYILIGILFFGELIVRRRIRRPS